ncbi:LPXTG cell wall anchor domain-containing protein [Streptomyces sp. SDr-06]|uniref:lytic polysaccharide monooxygenase auxiliary activity family 9 protein n=1 Tax=Streptomyces sp. SDr-06 TaxID=2267702 RepID=UPI000DEA1194|nr:lytic polysaccharide monooxygenase [Streptomyces sp. SDr-06]RCH65065.1 LPXTG cell wall anchor domain-containing protein [Streptomyces sp. SDr-06]
MTFPQLSTAFEQRGPRRRRAAVVAALGFTPLALTGLAAGPAAAHGSMTDPVSRVSACYAEGPESPKSAACKAAVAVSGAQAFYDWNAVNMANAAGRSKEIIPDGRLCSGGNDKYKGLDLARADWPATKLSAGSHTFHYKGTAPHKGSFALYITKVGYDPSKPLKWSDLEATPFAEVTDPPMRGGDYVFEGKIPARSGRHLIYSIWQRSDSPEAFYTCSDVVFGKDSGTAGAPAPTASAPTEQEIADGAAKSTVQHHHGDATTGTRPSAAPVAGADAAGNNPQADGAAATPVGSTGTPGTQNLAETGGDSSTRYLALAGAGAIAIGAAALFATLRRKAVAGGRHGR